MISGISVQNVPTILQKITNRGAELQGLQEERCVRNVYSLKSLMKKTASLRYVKTALTPSFSLLLVIEKGFIRKSYLLKNPSDVVWKEFEAYFFQRGDVEVDLDTLSLEGINSDCLKVYRFLKENISFGEVVTYSELGKISGFSPRFVGFCMRINPFPVIIPCHRVIAKTGLGGYSAGVELKKELLKHEGILS